MKGVWGGTMGRVHVAIFAEPPFGSLSLKDRNISAKMGYL